MNPAPVVKTPAIDEIIRHKKKEVEETKKQRPLNELKRIIGESGFRRAEFMERSRLDEGLYVISEVKYKSPSTGLIRNRDRESLEERIRAYEDAGASAISVITDQKYFGGDTDLMKKVKESARLPVLRKDFIIDEYQVYESKAYGADAILIIAAILEREEIRRIHETADGLGLKCLVEIHKEEDIKKLPAGAKIIGINNRDLSDPAYKTNIDVTIRLAPLLDERRIIVSESGINKSNIKKLIDINVAGILIGTELMYAEPRESADIIKNLILLFSQR